MIIEERNQNTACPAGNFNAVCVGVYDLGIQPSKNGWAAKRKLAICFEIEKQIEGGALSGQPYRISRIVSLSFNKKSTLTEMLLSWFGKNPTAAASGMTTFDFAALIGKPCTLSVAQQSKDGDTRAIVTSVSPHMEGMKVLASDYDAYGPAPEWVERIRAERMNKHEPLCVAKCPEALDKAEADEEWEEVKDNDDQSSGLGRSDDGNESRFC